MDYDWTLCKDDWGREQRLRDIRNLLIHNKLEMGRTVAYRQSGWSCYPMIHSNDLCYFQPVYHDPGNAKVGDIVFCLVEPGPRYYAHQVKTITCTWYDKTKRTEQCYTISNLKGRENGWCFIDQIYGKMYRIMH